MSECRICHQLVSVPDDLKDTGLCNLCAQGLVLDLQAELDKHRWIPVEERLPKRGEKVDGYVKKLKLRIANLKGDYVNHKQTITDSDGWQVENLTHWKPIILPEGE